MKRDRPDNWRKNTQASRMDAKAYRFGRNEVVPDVGSGNPVAYFVHWRPSCKNSPKNGTFGASILSSL